MSSEERVKAELSARSFSACLVEGDAEENARERKIKRRAVGISVVVQSAALAVFVIAPLFANCGIGGENGGANSAVSK